MSTGDFQVEQIDHITLFVPDRYEAAQWYEQVLGLEICREYKKWADEGGPLMISSDGGRTMLAVFEGQSSRLQETDVEPHIAFRVDGVEFLKFVDRIEEMSITDEGNQVSQKNIVDHKLSFSIYFHDPYGNRFEVTTYNYQAVAQTLEC